ncbi:hypothetical protein A9Q84_14460 [Halobacteriovorax marinus]|uniref:Dynamin N-terminal domain-containing protein n=1 Tax=Halobacteriovorax marinus TaxID=97084 RepID=A0A1Y5F4W3_9BACT|nr:hypothetical protein A9Q84_14460 [Halobacteriovorax marinus]
MSCVFNKITDVLNEIGITEYISVVEECKDIYDSPEIRIGLWGDFSSGKSSFLNAMLGREIFPVNITEMTAMVTELRYGERLELVAVKDGKEYCYPYTKELAHILLTRVFKFDDLKPSARKKLDTDIFEKAISKIREDGLHGEGAEFDDFLDKVIVKCNFDVLKSGIVFVDLPGLKGSSSHSALTAQEIKNCSMVIYFKSSDRPLSKYDKEVLDDLKDANEKMVLFGIYNKCDLELKSHHKELGNKEFVIKARKELLDTFINDVEKFAKLDEYFTISPLMMHYYKMIEGNESEALKALKNDHPSKFRFLKEDHHYDLIAGISDFDERFFKTINELREYAKKRVIEGKFVRVIKEIDGSILKREEAIKSTVELSVDEYEDAMENLALQEKKHLQLKSFGPKVQMAIRSELTRFVSENVQKIAEKTLGALSNRMFNNQGEFNHELTRNMSKEVSSFLMNEGKTDFCKVVDKGLKSIENDIGLILEDISEVTGMVLDTNKKVDLGHVVDSTKLEIVEFEAGISVDNQLTGGAAALDVGMMLADVGTFGMATMARLAFAGMKSMDEGRGFLAGVGDVIDGIFSLFDSTEEKERKAMANFRENLKDSTFRRNTVNSISSQMEPAYIDYLSNIVVQILQENERVAEEINAILPKVEEARRIVQDTLDNKQLSEEEKRTELLKTQQGREVLNNSLNEFFNNLEKLAA